MHALIVTASLICIEVCTHFHYTPANHSLLFSLSSRDHIIVIITTVSFMNMIAETNLSVISVLLCVVNLTHKAALTHHTDIL